MSVVIVNFGFFNVPIVFCNLNGKFDFLLHNKPYLNCIFRDKCFRTPQILIHLLL